MFERFTEGARQAVVLAQDEARDLKHDYIGTEHLLLGLLREKDGLASRLLAALNVELEDVRHRVERSVGVGDETPVGQIPFTPRRSKKVLELSLREALSLGHNYIGTEHILLGLVRENEGVAARLLLDLGHDSEAIRTETVACLSGPRQYGIDWRWRSLARAIDQVEALPRPSQTVAELSLQQVLSAIDGAQDEAISGQDLDRARELTKLKSDVLHLARWAQTVLEQELPRSSDEIG